MEDRYINEILWLLALKPGDTVIVRMPGQMTPREFDEASDMLASMLPDVKVVVVNAEEITTYRPGEQCTLCGRV